MATKAGSRMTPLKLFSYTMVALWLIIAAFPFLWTFWGSFKVQADFLSKADWMNACLLYTSPSPRDRQKSRMPSSA